MTRANGQLKHLQEQHVRLALDLFECAHVLAVSLHFQPEAARQVQLDALLPGGRQTVTAGLAVADARSGSGADRGVQRRAIKNEIARAFLAFYNK